MDMSQHPSLDGALELIEENILPTISTLLDTLVEAAALALPGTDAEAHAAELREIGRQVEMLVRQVEALAPAGGAQFPELRMPA